MKPRTSSRPSPSELRPRPPSIWYALFSPLQKRFPHPLFRTYTTIFMPVRIRQHFLVKYGPTCVLLNPPGDRVAGWVAYSFDILKGRNRPVKPGQLILSHQRPDEDTTFCPYTRVA